MAVDLTGLPIRTADPKPYRLGATVRGAMGGSQRINRLGDRWVWSFETPTMLIEPDGRRWSSALTRAAREGALIRIHEPSLPVRPYGAPVVRTATPAGRTVPVGGLQPGTPIVAGKWLSVIVAGQRYLDRTAAQVIAGADGTADIVLENLIRVALPLNAVVEIAAPYLQGGIDGDVGGGWTVDHFTSFGFTITEDA